jgi:nickel/cobalt transporter (NiCoT) family protein
MTVGSSVSKLLAQTFGLHDVRLRRRLAVLYGFLVIANLGAWAWAFCSCREHPALLGTAFLAYCLGMRHAVDADHIAAIDNVTRKLIQDGGRPISVGFWFAFGHSSVVLLATLAIALVTLGLPLDFDSRFGPWKDIGATIRSSVAASFLLMVAALNFFILADIWKTFRRIRKGGACSDEAEHALQNRGGVLATMFRPLFGLVTRDWHMLLLGFLFALGFDTATEVGLLGISGAQAGQGMSIWVIMVFPVLFAAGMALIDTTDGVLMLGAYNWAFVKPSRKLHYNLVITAVSVVVAGVVGGVQVLGLVGDRFTRQGWFWDTIRSLNDHFNEIGFAIVGVFILAWIASLAIYRYAPIDEFALVAERNSKVSAKVSAT